jgi:hypothetical protein
MGTNPIPQPLSPEAEQKRMQGELEAAKSHYTELLAYFKHLVWLTFGALTLITLVGGYFFSSSLQNTLAAIKTNATQLAETEAKKRVSEAFEEKNIKAEIADVARDKIGTITDKMIEQQLTSKLQPIQQRIILIGRISECEARIHVGFRSALMELNTILREATDPSVRQFASSTLTTTTEAYDSFWQASPQWQAALHQPSSQLVMVLNQQRYVNGGSDPVSDLGGVVHVINEDQDLNGVAIATLIFRQMTGYKDVKMFDFAAVNKWCASHEPQCKPEERHK